MAIELIATVIAAFIAAIASVTVAVIQQRAAAAAIRTGQTAYVNGSKITGTIADQAGGTYTPTTSDQTVASASKYLTSNVIVKGDANLVAANIASGVTIFNVEGTYEGEPEYIVSSTEPSASSSYKIWIQP